MRKLFFSCIGFLVAMCSASQTVQQHEPRRVHLPNGWSLTPVGRNLPLKDLPLNIVVSPTKKYLAVTNNGHSTQYIQLIDPKNEKIVSSIKIPTSWYGLKFSADEKFLYASGGNDNWILKYAIQNKKLILKDSIFLGYKWPYKISPAGVEIDDAKLTMYVVTKENNSLYTIDLKTKKSDSLSLGAEAFTCL